MLTLTSCLLTTLVGTGTTETEVTATEFTVERVSTKPPFPRGLQLVDGELYVLCRGRVREYGGVSAEVEDQAGTLYARPGRGRAAGLSEQGSSRPAGSRAQGSESRDSRRSAHFDARDPGRRRSRGARTGE